MPKRRSLGAAASSCVVGGKRRKLLTLSQRTDKAVKDNCKGWSNYATRVRKNSDNKTLWDCVHANLERKDKDPDFKFGALRWRALKAEFSCRPQQSVALRVPEPAEPLCEKIIKAVQACQRQRPDREPLKTYMATRHEPNMTEVVGVFRIALTFIPAQKKVLPACQAVMRWIVRCNLDKKFVDAVGTMSGWMDDVMCCTYQEAKKPPDEFLDLWLSLCKLVLPVQPLVNALSNRSAPEKCDDDLCTLVSSSMLGELLFADVVATNVARSVEETITSKLAVVQTMELDRTQIDTLVGEIMEDIESAGNVDLLPVNRVARIRYRSASFEEKVRSIAHQVNLSAAGAWKGRAVELGHLHQTWVDRLLFGDTDITYVPPQGTIAELVAFSQDARLEFDKQYKEHDFPNGDAVDQHFKSRSTRFMSIDGDWGLEMLLLDSCCGSMAGPRLMEKALKLTPYPARGHHITPTSSMQQLTALSRHTAFKLAPSPFQAKVELMAKWVGRIVDSRPPDFHKDRFGRDAELEQAVKQIEFWCTFTPKKSAGKTPTALYGGDALRCFVKEAAANKSKPTQQDVSLIKIWAHLIPADVDSSAKELLDKAESTEPGSSAKAKAAPKSKTKASDAAIAAAMAVFQN